MLLGTVSQYVLRKAPCPVLVVPAGSRSGAVGAWPGRLCGQVPGWPA